MGIEFEYIVKTLIFIVCGGFGIYFVYREAKELEMEVLENERECKQKVDY